MPLSGFKLPAIVLKSVDLPAPFVPIIVIKSPDLISKLIPFKIGTISPSAVLTVVLTSFNSRIGLVVLFHASLY